MLARDIYRDFYNDPGPTLEEKLLLAGKRVCILFAGCALTLGVLDVAGIHSISAATEAWREAPIKLANLGETMRRGVSSISIPSSLESVSGLGSPPAALLIRDCGGPAPCCWNPS